jgi:hypothetical protein
MDNNIRRDQIWFTQNTKNDGSNIYSLSDFNGVRKSDLFSKNYLLGIYGAVPFKD